MHASERVILVDENLPYPERIATLAAALAQIDLEHLYLPPIVRKTIEGYAKHVDLPGASSNDRD